MNTRSWFVFVLLFAVFVVLGDFSFAGTGGGELQTVWDEIAQGLQGFWGKIIAAVFFGMTLMFLSGGRILMSLTTFIIAMLLAVIPGIIDARYTLTF